MDALNMVVPYKDKHYYDMRPTLAIPPEATEGKPGVVVLDKKFGLHPALAALEPFWKAGRFAPVVCAGSPHPTRSHFDAQDFMEYAAPGLRTVRDGWLNRYLAATHREVKKEALRLRALAMQGLLPRSLRGRYSVLAVPERDVLENQAMLEMFGTLYGQGKGGMPAARRDEAEDLRATGRYTVETLKRFRTIIKREESGGAAYPGGALGAKLRAIARVIKAGAGLEVAAVDVNGWDTHANEGGIAGGTMPRLMKGLADSLAAFMTDLGPLLDWTLVVTMTEFGRTCRENGNYGTDHGHGGVMLLLGGKLRGGRVHGKWSGLAEKDLYQNRDLKVTTDFRDVFAEILTGHFRFKPPKGFFPGYKPSRVRGLFA